MATLKLSHNSPLKYNLLVVASAEEEIAGDNSLRGLIPKLPKIDVAIVGEPTEMNLAVAEKGLIVFGQGSGHGVGMSQYGAYSRALSVEEGGGGQG